ncbi:MAG TPA: molybdopterin cofactor-binding domain-containing protein, partial [bacterium]|nr:molybdopterin cofactor-binding domain-containing protein [bacterium]
INAKAVVVAAHLLEAAPRDVIAGGGRFSVRGVHGRSVAWAEVARAAHAPAAAGLSRSSAGLEATASYDPPPAAFSNGVHMAMVEVGCDTGQVAVLRYAIAEDCGPLVNPLLVEGQIHGGLAQGLGEAFLEEVRYDDSGQPLTATFMDYLIPAAVKTPSVKLVHLETRSPFTAGGFKGMGEPATIGAPACIANAVSDALRRSVEALPITPSASSDGSAWAPLPPPHLRGDPRPPREPHRGGPTVRTGSANTPAVGRDTPGHGGGRRGKVR